MFDLVSADDVLADPEPLVIAAASGPDIDSAVADVVAELTTEGRDVEVLVAIGGVDPTAVLALDPDTPEAAVVTLDYDVAANGVELVEAAIAVVAS